MVGRSGRRIRHLSVRVLGLGIVVSVIGCGGGGEPTVPAPVVTPPAPVPVASLSIASGTVAVGGSIPRKAWSGLQLVQQASWKSDDPSIASVSADGVVTGVRAGTTTIHATQGQATGSAEITVADLKFRQLVVGGRNVCAQADSGAWYCWGGNGVGTVGRLSGSPEICAAQRAECSTTPRIPVGLPSFQKMSISGGGLTCGLTVQGSISCWGRNDNHVFFGGPTEMCEVYSGADDVPNAFLVCRHDPAAIPSPLTFTDVVAGGVVCGITADGTAHCWGDAAFGQLGVDATATCDGIPCVPSPGPPVPGLKFRQMSVGSGSTCAITLDGGGYCWGWNHIGERGADVPEGRVPNTISGSHTFAGVWTFRDHACGVTTSGDGYCWGSNSVGQLGRSTSELSATSSPVLVQGGLKFISITPGLVSTCGLSVDGDAYCWGENSSGQLGDGTTQPRSSPTKVVGGHRFTQVSSGRHATCGLTVAGTVYCWGGNTFGELGYGESGTELFGSYFSPVPVGIGGFGR